VLQQSSVTVLRRQMIIALAFQVKVERMGSAEHLTRCQKLAKLLR
jgi:hypothetical protein